MAQKGTYGNLPVSQTPFPIAKAIKQGASVRCAYAATKAEFSPAFAVCAGPQLVPAALADASTAASKVSLDRWL